MVCSILAVVYGPRSQFTRDRFEQVHESQRKGMESSDAEPLKSQVKHILNYILCPNTLHKPRRLQELSTVKFCDVLSHYEDMMLRHSAEAMLFGNLTSDEADVVANLAVGARHNYLEARAADEGVQPEVNPHLEEWYEVFRRIHFSRGEMDFGM